MLFREMDAVYRQNQQKKHTLWTKYNIFLPQTSDGKYSNRWPGSSVGIATD